MKVIKKAKLPTITCNLCGCVFRPHSADLKRALEKHEFMTSAEDLRPRIYTFCPTCGLLVYPFKKEDKL